MELHLDVAAALRHGAWARVVLAVRLSKKTKYLWTKKASSAKTPPWTCGSPPSDLSSLGSVQHRELTEARRAFPPRPSALLQLGLLEPMVLRIRPRQVFSSQMRVVSG